MTEQKLTYKQRQAKAKRIKYWRVKLEQANLMYFVLDDDDKLKQIYKTWQERQGRPIIPDEALKTVEQQDTSINEFYQIKKSFEKDIDREWIRKVNLDREEGERKSDSSRNKAIRSGVSPLLFDIMSPKAKEYELTSGHLIKRKKNIGISNDP